MANIIADFQSSKCSPVKNACKICFEQVTNKNGLQCKGACKKWAHFKCLHYTKGKIADIKGGALKVLCPCPDCETTQAKEYLTNPPYTCSHHDCPGNARGPAKCTSDECPHNKIRKKELCAPKTCAANAIDSPNISINNSNPKILINNSNPKISINNSNPKKKELCAPKACATDVVDNPTQTKYPSRRKTYFDSPTDSQTALDTQTQTETINRKSKKASSSKDNSCEDLECDEQNEGIEEDQMKYVLDEMCGTITELSNQLKDLMCKIKKKKVEREPSQRTK